MRPWNFDRYDENKLPGTAEGLLVSALGLADPFSGDDAFRISAAVSGDGGLILDPYSSGLDFVFRLGAVTDALFFFVDGAGLSCALPTSDFFF